MDADPGGPKTCGFCGSGSPTLLKAVNITASGRGKQKRRFKEDKIKVKSTKVVGFKQ
jgi:hypothetical protein